MALHNGPQNDKKSFEFLKEFSFKSQPISDFSDEEFESKITELSNSTKRILQGGIQLNRQEDILLKLDTILFILELSIAAENFSISDSKKETIWKLQKNTMEQIALSIKNINNNIERWCNPKDFDGLDGIQYRSAHQRLLMINSLLFYYAQTLHKNKTIENFFEYLIDFNLTIEEKILIESKKYAIDQRSRDTAGTSKTEEKMICFFKKNITYGNTSQFESIKNDMMKNFIEPTTGLELDFPLKNKITIEFDGPTHFFQGKKEIFGTLEHLRKERQLLENGWIRISLSTTMLNKYQQNMGHLTSDVTEILTSMETIKYLEMHKELNDLRSLLRENIKSIHSELKRNVGKIDVGQQVMLLQSCRKQSQKEKKLLQKKPPLLFSEKLSNLPVAIEASSKVKEELRCLFETENRISTFLAKNQLNTAINDERFQQNIETRFRLENEKNALIQQAHWLNTQIKIKISNISKFQAKIKQPFENNSEWRKQQESNYLAKIQRAILNQKIHKKKEDIQQNKNEFNALLSKNLAIEELKGLIAQTKQDMKFSGEIEKHVDPKIYLAGESEESQPISVKVKF